MKKTVKKYIWNVVFLCTFLIADVFLSIFGNASFIQKHPTFFEAANENRQWSFIVLWLISLTLPYIIYIVHCKWLNYRKKYLNETDIMYFIKAPFYLVQLPFMINMILEYNAYTFELFLLFFAIMTIIFEIIVYPLLSLKKKKTKRPQNKDI